MPNKQTKQAMLIKQMFIMTCTWPDDLSEFFYLEEFIIY